MCRYNPNNRFFLTIPKLFSTNQRTLLLFVIRDFIGTTPLANLSTTLAADIQKIWDSLSKPTELQGAKLSDYFDLSFTALPHKILAADKFESEVKELRKRFADKNHENYVFKPSYHKRIPADGVALYMENIWVRGTAAGPQTYTKMHHLGTSSSEQGFGFAHAARAPSTIPM